jgi:hypothetical protein
MKDIGMNVHPTIINAVRSGQSYQVNPDASAQGQEG